MFTNVKNNYASVILFAEKKIKRGNVFASLVR